jgi:hypothetical protein
LDSLKGLAKQGVQFLDNSGLLQKGIDAGINKIGAKNELLGALAGIAAEAGKNAVLAQVGSGFLRGPR